MPRPRKPPRRPPELPTPQADGAYDIEQTERIVRAMDFLATEARKTGIEEIVTMVESAFRIVNTTYYCLLRLDMMSLPPAPGHRNGKE